MRTLPLPLVLCLLLCGILSATAPLPAQEPPTAAEIAVFRGRAPTAAALADLGPPDREWLAAARKPALARAEAFLDLADTHPGLCARALIGAAGSLLTARRVASAIPGLDPNDDDRDELDDLPPVAAEARIEAAIHRVERLHAAVVRAGASAEVLAEAGWMVPALRTGKPSLAMQVPSGSEIHVPAPRDRALELRWYRSPGVDLDSATFYLRYPALEPARTERIPAGDAAAETAVPAPGAWLLEVREPVGGRRQLRPVRVSDLAFDCVALGSQVVVAARLGDAPAAGATVTVHGSRSGLLITAGRCDEQGLATLPVSPAYGEAASAESVRVEVRSGAHTARVDLRNIGRPLAVRNQLIAHVFCERPLYRPGEAVRGRIFVRRVEAVAGKPHGSPMRGANCTLRLWPRRHDEQVVRGALDRHGVLTFETRIPATMKPGRVPGELEIGGVTVDLGRVFRVDPFRRSPLRVRLDAPSWLAPGARGTAELEARWSHGAVAAGARVHVAARIGGVVQRLDSQLGADGRLRIRLPEDDRFFAGDEGALELRTTVTGPDGQGVEGRAEIRLPEAPDAGDDRPRIAGGDRTVEPGEAARFELRCRPQARGLCVLWLPDRVVARGVRFDAQGKGDAHFTIPRDARGLARVVLAVAGRDAGCTARIVAPESTLRIALETEHRSFPPGAPCDLTFRVTDGRGEPVRATLSAVLVDERLLALEDVDDRAAVAHLGRPWWEWERHDGTAWPQAEPWRLIGDMLAGGRPAGKVRLHAYNGPAGTVPNWTTTPLDVPEDLIRKRFRPSAGYRACLTTGEDGRVGYRCRLPDDLTTWRLRVVAVDAALGQGAARFALTTAKPLAVEAALPRFLRLGDRVLTIPVVAGAPGEREVGWTARAGSGLAVEHGATLTAGLTLTARGTGAGRFELGVRAGGHDDALRRTLPIERDVVREALEARSAAKDTWHRPALPGADELDTLVVGAGRAALLAGLRATLDRYPYRCAEQTGSRLLGLCGRAVPEDPVAALQAEAMFGRLVSLWHPRSLLYAWWPAARGDPGITALVLHTLAELQEAGHPIARYGLAIETTDRRLEALARKVRELGSDLDAGEVAEAERAIALLRLVPRNVALRDAVGGILREHPGLPHGLLARAGLALAAAGEREAALAIARAMRGGAAVRSPGLDLGERTRVRLAFELRLRQELDLADDVTLAIEEALLRDVEGRGFVNTWSAACALHALACGGTPEDLPETIPVEVRIDGALRELALDAENHYRVEIPLAGKRLVEVRSPSGREVRVRLRGARCLPAATFAPRGNGLSVTRGIANVAAGSPVERGRLYRIGIKLTASREARYLVVRCPLPAGAELQGRPGGLERQGDAVVATVSRLGPGTPWRIDVPVVFGFEGSVLWPPVHVYGMYDDSAFAYTAGRRLTVEPAGKPPADAGGAGEVAVLAEAWRRERAGALLAHALAASDGDKAVVFLRAVEQLRAPLTGPQCDRWLEPLFARHRGRWFRSVLFGLPGVREGMGEPASAFAFARARYRRGGDPALRRRLLAAPDPVFESLVVELLDDTEDAIASWVDAHLRADDIRHAAVTASGPEISAELALAEAVYARVERTTSTLDLATLDALAEFGESLLEAKPRGAAPGPVETEIRRRLEALRRRGAVLRARLAPADDLTVEERLAEAIEASRWGEIPRVDWPEELDWLSRRDVEALSGLGAEGVRYLVAQANASARIWDEAHWLATLAAGPRVDLAVLAPLLRDEPRDGRADVVVVPHLRRVATGSLVAACRRDPAPFRRLLYLRELARRGTACPLEADGPAERPYHVFWRCLHGDADSRGALETLLLAPGTPEGFTLGAWSALLPDPGCRVYRRVFGVMTERERRVGFAHLSPAERRSILEEEGVRALPCSLPADLLRELAPALWSGILADPATAEETLDRFVRSAGGLACLRERLACAHEANLAIASQLLRESGLALPFRAGSGLLLSLAPGDEAARERLALLWLEGGMEVPPHEAPREAILRVLGRRGCVLR